MKKLLLLCIVLTAFLASEAQTTKGQTKKTKKPSISREAIVKARLDSLETARQLSIDSILNVQVRIDSARKFNDSIASVKSAAERMAWKENRDREIDSLNKLHVKMLSKEHEQSLTVQRQRRTINKTAKLNDYQGQQVDYINQIFFGKAQTIKEDASISEDQKKQQLVVLNEERKSRLKTVIGKSKEKKFEKTRKANPNTIDAEVQWVNEVDGVVKN